MERQSLSMDQKTQYCLNAYTTQRELQIQFNLYQKAKGSLHRTRIILKFVWKHRTPHVAKVILRKKNKAGCIKLSNFKLYHRTIVTQ